MHKQVSRKEVSVPVAPISTSLSAQNKGTRFCIQSIALILLLVGTGRSTGPEFGSAFATGPAGVTTTTSTHTTTTAGISEDAFFKTLQDVLRGQSAGSESIQEPQVTFHSSGMRAPEQTLEEKLCHSFVMDLFSIMAGMHSCHNCCVCHYANAKYPCGRKIIEKIEELLDRNFSIGSSRRENDGARKGLFDHLAEKGSGTSTDFVKRFMGLSGFEDLKLTFLIALETFVPATCNQSGCSFCTPLYEKEGFGVYRGVRALFAGAREEALYAAQAPSRTLTNLSLIDYKTLKSTLEIFLSLVKVHGLSGHEALAQAGAGGSPNIATNVLRDMLRSFGIIPLLSRDSGEYCFGSPGSGSGLGSSMFYHRIPSVYNRDVAFYGTDRSGVLRHILERVSVRPESHQVLHEAFSAPRMPATRFVPQTQYFPHARPQPVHNFHPRNRSAPSAFNRPVGLVRPVVHGTTQGLQSSGCRTAGRRTQCSQPTINISHFISSEIVPGPAATRTIHHPEADVQTSRSVAPEQVLVQTMEQEVDAATQKERSKAQLIAKIVNSIEKREPQIPDEHPGASGYWTRVSYTTTNPQHNRRPANSKYGFGK